MLNPDYLLHISEGAENIAEQLHTDIINRIIERVMIRIGRGDSYLLTAQDKWQLEVLQDAGYLLEDIQREIAKRTRQQEKEIAAAMEDAGVRALSYDDAIYIAAGLSPVPLMQSPSLMRLMQRNYEATLGEWRNYTRTTANAAQQLFLRAVDKAYTLTASGTISYTQAVREAINEIVQDGVVVKYPSGHQDTIETATLRAVRTGISQATGAIQMARMEEMDWDIILTSAHVGARSGDGGQNPSNHLWWQGQFFSRTGRTPGLPLFVESTGYGTEEWGVVGLCGANCRHSFGPGDGVNNPFALDDIMYADNAKAEKLQQKQREIERTIRRIKRETMTLKTAVDNAEGEEERQALDADYQKSAAYLQKWNTKYDTFCKENNLKPLRDRLEIAQWDRKQAAAARGAAQRYNTRRNSVVKSISLDDLQKVNVGSNGNSIISSDIIDEIGKTLKDKGALGSFDGVSMINTDMGIVFNTKTSQRGSWCSNELQINKGFFAGKTLEQANFDMKAARNTVCNSVSDAVIHEVYHAKTADKMNYSMYEALSETGGAKGVSTTAQKDALEAIAEIGVLYERGEYDNISEEDRALFEEYFLR